MAIFDNFPYTDFHKLNLDWVIERIKALTYKVDNLNSLPVGGTTDQVLAKLSDTDYDYTWKTLAAGPQGPQGPTGPQGPQGPTGPQGEQGNGLKILGIYATLQDLQTAHPTGTAGDAYAVGTSASNTTYIWDSATTAWKDIGSIVGHGIPSGGTTGQMLSKSSNSDYAVEWSDVPNGQDHVHISIPMFASNDGTSKAIGATTVTKTLTNPINLSEYKYAKAKLSIVGGQTQSTLVDLPLIRLITTIGGEIYNLPSAFTISGGLANPAHSASVEHFYNSDVTIGENKMVLTTGQVGYLNNALTSNIAGVYNALYSSSSIANVLGTNVNLTSITLSESNGANDKFISIICELDLFKNPISA